MCIRGLPCVLTLVACAVVAHAKKQPADKGEGTGRMLAEIDASTGGAEVAPPQSTEMAVHEAATQGMHEEFRNAVCASRA